MYWIIYTWLLGDFFDDQKDTKELVVIMSRSST